MSAEVQVRRLIQEASVLLAAAGLENPRLEAENLLADLLNVRRLELFSGPDLISTLRAEEFQRRVTRRAAREPAAYIRGGVSFFGREFLVNPDVLIPRPETEELVEYVLNKTTPSESRSLIDIGAGSGCIGLTLLLERPGWTATLVDVSAPALAVARRNAAHLGVDPTRLVFVQSNLWDALPEALFDVIVSNPPYIHPDEASGLEADVRGYEPHNALFDDDPESLAVRLMKGAAERLAPGGIFIMETSPRWAASLKQASADVFGRSEVRADISGMDRFVCSHR